MARARRAPAALLGGRRVLLTATAAAVGVGGRLGVAAVGAHPARARHPRADPPGAVRAGGAAHRGVDPPGHARAGPGPRPARGGRCAAAPRPDRRDVFAVTPAPPAPSPHPDAASPAPTWCTRLWPRPAGCCAPPPNPTCWSSPRWPAPAAGTPGPVLVFDTTGSVAWPAQVRWSPISGCDDIRTAYQRARTLVEAAAVNLTDLTSGNDRVFRERATMVAGRLPAGRGAVSTAGSGCWSGGPSANHPTPSRPTCSSRSIPSSPQPAHRDRSGRPDFGRGVAVGASGDRAAARSRVAGVVHARARRRVRRPRAHQPGRDAVPDRR